MRHGFLGGRAAKRGFARLKPGLDRFRNVACARVMIAQHRRLATFSNGVFRDKPRCDPRMELTPFLLEQRGVGDFLYHRVLEREERALRLLAAIYDPGFLERLQRMLQRFAFTWKHAENAFIVKAPSENGGNLGNPLGGAETIKALHQGIMNACRHQWFRHLPAWHKALSGRRTRPGVAAGRRTLLDNEAHAVALFA